MNAPLAVRLAVEIGALRAMVLVPGAFSVPTRLSEIVSNLERLLPKITRIERALDEIVADAADDARFTSELAAAEAACPPRPPARRAAYTVHFADGRSITVANRVVGVAGSPTNRPCQVLPFHEGGTA